MPSIAKRPMDEFLLSLAILLVLPLLPLIIEFFLTFFFKSDSPRYLERSSVMLTAPMLTIAVAMASRYKSIAGYCLIGALCLAAMYGAQAMRAKPTPGEGDNEQESRQQGPVRPTPSVQSRDSTKTPGPPSTFFDRMDMDELPGRVAWGAMILVSGILIVERAIRHLRFAEPLEFEWNK